MRDVIRIATALAAAFALAAGGAIAQPRDKEQKQPKEHKEQKERGDKPAKEKKQKEHKHQNGKDLVGDKIKQNGKHKVHEHGKHSAFVNVRDGKIAGMSVTHAEKGEVPVKKYKTSKKMAAAETGGLQPASLVLAQYRENIGTTWIGYAYIDDWGDEVIYWYPYDMIYDGDTGAIEYIPAY
ncbi:MAG TPA: hypothetical protein VFK48_17200 [Usitatibacter sp.]|nr:hypothetical protein [Usitatibacter sp.]